jgi:hypothetical protein
VSHGHDTTIGMKRFLAINAEKFSAKWPEMLEAGANQLKANRVGASSSSSAPVKR